MKIKDVIASPGLSGFYFDDQKAIINNAEPDGFTYSGNPLNQNFKAIRQAGESVSIMLILENDQIAQGDCAAVQYSGAGGRDPLFLAQDFIPFIEDTLAEKLIGRELNSFKQLAEEFDSIRKNGKKLHTALRYGITQAILDGVAKAQNITMTEVVAEEYNLNISTEPVPIFCQTGDSRYHNVDKMIIKEAEVIPHGLINNLQDKLGTNGKYLIDYIKWMKKRIRKLRTNSDYNPIFHIDVYGTIGEAFDHDQEKMVDYLEKLSKIASPYLLRIEEPLDVGSRAKQIARMKSLKERINRREIDIELVADEWCNTLEDIKVFADNGAADLIQIKTPDLGGLNNTIEAVLYCQKRNVGAYQGGSCNETDRSAQICTQVALATRPDQILAKPGMGVDEGLMIVKNEMNRTLSLIKRNNQ